MALVLRSLYQGYKQYYQDTQDPRMTDKFLMNPPWVPLALVSAYLYFVLKLGPKLMANRKPFNLRPILIWYNILQVATNLYLAISGFILFSEKDFHWSCQPVDRSASALATREVELVHYYFLLKVADLLDTVFFVLMKKQSHVSFLHVYHHTAMVLGPFVFIRLHPGGHGSMLGLVNTIVHAVMYFYFFMSVYRPEAIKDIRWKRYLTMLQMAQFVGLTFFFGNPAVRGLDCGIPVYWFWSVMLQNLFMLVMFADFYYKAYGYKKSKQQ